MKARTRVGSVALAATLAALAATGGSASAFGSGSQHGGGPLHGAGQGERPGSIHHFGPAHPPIPIRGRGPAPAGPHGVVFVQTDNTAGNQIVVYDRAGNGTLSQAGVYSTGGLGGALEGSVVDHLSSEGSLAYDAQDGLLYAVNAGSDTVSVFAVSGDRLALRQVIGSGGSFPVSVAVSGGLMYVLNAGSGGSVQGYRVSFDRLVPIGGSSRQLGLTETLQFEHTPGQIAFSPDGSQLIVTTKANGDDIDVFGVDQSGQLSAIPVVNSEPGAVPFGVTFNPQGDLVVAETGPDAIASFALSRNGTLTPLDLVDTGQVATCWVVSSGNDLFASNAGSGTLSDLQSEFGGELTLSGDTETNAGTVDASVSADGRFLYVQTGAAGIVDEYAIGAHGALSRIGGATVPGAVGGEGIVAQ